MAYHAWNNAFVFLLDQPQKYPVQKGKRGKLQAAYKIMWKGIGSALDDIYKKCRPDEFPEEFKKDKPVENFLAECVQQAENDNSRPDSRP